MYNEPYLETCCRAALHRLSLAAQLGRPHGLRDEPCLERLAAMGLVEEGERWTLTEAGAARHASEVLKAE